MIEGWVTRNGLPVITVSIMGREYEALIDTGFNGDLELPTELKEHVNPRLIGSATSALAAGVVVREDVYLVDFPFDGTPVEAEATFVDGEGILIGTKLLREHQLEVDFPRATLRITRER